MGKFGLQQKFVDETEQFLYNGSVRTKLKSLSELLIPEEFHEVDWWQLLTNIWVDYLLLSLVFRLISVSAEDLSIQLFAYVKECLREPLLDSFSVESQKDHFPQLVDGWELAQDSH